MSPSEMNKVATRFVPRVQKIARGVCSRLPAYISADDLTQAGIVGMMTALRSFDKTREASLEAYVLRRIRGAILDELRALDPLSRDQRKDARAIQNATRELERELGRPAGEDEIARRSGMPLERVRAVKGLAGAVTPLSIDGVFEVVDSKNEDPVDRIAKEEMRMLLVDAVTELSDREQMVLQLYYVEELSLKEIGSLMGVTESRVCQIHGVAIKKLRTAMQTEDLAA